MTDPLEVAFARAFPAHVPIPASAIKATLTTIYPRALSPDCFDVLVAGEMIHIPARIHFADLSWRPMRHGTAEEQVQQCLFTRSMDGYVRQRALRQILPINQPWTMPYIVALVGEYVWEILDDILNGFEQIDKGLLCDFLRANPGYVRLVRARVESYYGYHHRRKFARKDYCGFALMAHFDALLATPPTQKSPA